MSRRLLGLAGLVVLTAACSSTKTDAPALGTAQHALDPEDIGCRIGASPPPATIAWETEGLTGTVSAGTWTYARVKNWTTSGLYVRVFLRAEGIDGRAVERDLTTTTIDPEDTIDVPFRWEDLPLQSATSTSMASVVVELIEGDITPEQEHTQIPSGTLAYASYWDYEDFEFYGAQEEPTTLFYGSVEDAQDLHDGLATWDTWFNEREGRVWDGEELVNVNVVPLDDDPNMTPLRVNRFSAYDTLVFDTLPKTLAAGPTGTDKFCPKLPAWFVDSGFGESQANAKGLQYLPASYMDLEILRRQVISNVPFYEPYARHRLGSNGCTNQLDLPEGRYTLILRGEFVRSGMTLRLLDAQDLAPSAWSLTVDVGSHAPGITMSPRFAKEGTGTRAAAVAAQFLSTNSLAFPSGTHTIYSDKECPGGGVACWARGTAPDSSLYLYKNLAPVPHNTAWKYVVAHELGHMTQYATMGVTGTVDYTTGNEASYPDRCTADAAYDPTDRSHSLQSLEHPGEAVAEAFAHHVANLVWNAGQSAGKFVYYKELLPPCVRVVAASR